MDMATAMVMAPESLALFRRAGKGACPHRLLGVVVALSLAWFGAADAGAQETSSGLAATGGEAVAVKPKWTIQPRIAVTETFTDNAALNGNGQNSHGDQITQISPGIRIDGQGARLKAYVDYSLNQIYYAQDAGRNSTQNALTSFATLQAIENWLYLDYTGSISQQSISAFGKQSSSNVSVNSNSTETSSFRLSPYIKGRFLGFADYLLRYDRGTTTTKSNLASDSDTENWTASLSGATPLTSISWSVSATRLIADYSRGRETEADRLDGTLIWQVDPQIKLKLSAGQESNNYLGLEKESHPTHGYGVDWAPTERTLLSVLREKRFFGDGHNVTFTHRTPLSALRFTDSRDVFVSNQAGNVGLGSIYDLYFSLFASVEPDPIKRAQLVLVFLAANGISPTALVSSNFLSSQASLQRRRELSYALTGVRNTVTFTASQNRQQALSSQTLALFGDSLAVANVIRQKSLSVNWGFKLSPTSNVNAIAFRSNTTGNSTAGGNLHTTQKSLSVNFSTRVAAKTTASLGLRHTVSDSDTSPYTENVLTGTLTHQF